MAPLSEDGDDSATEQEVPAQQPPVNFADLLGPDCVIKRMDKHQKILGNAKPEEMQHELMSRAEVQKRLGACAEHVKDMSRAEKLEWALEMKDRANEFYAACNFEEAAKLYNDCLVALDLNGTPAENAQAASQLQLPVCTNLAACMVEMGRYQRCVEMCDIALSIDPGCAKALYRRGLARYRAGHFSAARPDLEAALRRVAAQREEGHLAEAEVNSLDDLERRVLAYLGHIRRFDARERAACQRMFEQPLYADRPGAPSAMDTQQVDDSDEAIDAALDRIRGDWNWCCRRRAKPKSV